MLALVDAATRGNAARVRELLKEDVDIDEADEHSDTALMTASLHSRAPVVRLLIEAGADRPTRRATPPS